MCKNRLSLNCDKTVCMLIGNRKSLNKCNQLNLNVNGKKLEQVNYVKYLGVSVDAELNWNTQVESVCKKVSKMVSFMGRLRHIINEQSMNLIYKSFILPQFDYADIVWDSGKRNHVNMIQKLQNRAGRLILKINPYSHTSTHQVHQTLQWDYIVSRRKQHLLQLVYKALHDMTPSYLTDKFERKENSYSLQSNFNLYLQIPRTNFCKRMVSYRGSREFNSLPLSIKKAASIDIFKRSLQEHISF